MESTGAAGPDRVLSLDREAVIAREEAVDERSRLAGQRERRADEREAAANQREVKADERDAIADARELAADRREAAATVREQHTDRRERELQGRERALGAAVDRLEERMLDAIERSRELVALNAQRLDRQEAEVKRSQAHRERQRAEIVRSAAETEGRLAARNPGHRDRYLHEAQHARTSARSAREYLSRFSD